MKSKKVAKKSTAKPVAKSAKRARKSASATRSVSPAKAQTGKPGSVAKKSVRKAAARKPRVGTDVLKHAALEHPAIFYRLNTLLHIVRNIAGYEDQLCTILHEIKITGTADPELIDELAEVLEDMPFTDFTQERDAVRAALDEGSAPQS